MAKMIPGQGTFQITSKLAYSKDLEKKIPQFSPIANITYYLNTFMT